MRLFSILALLVCLSLASCKKDEDNVVLIENYLAENNLTAEVTPEGLYYIIINEGTGTTHPNLNSEVTVFYDGYFLNGNRFDGNIGSDPISFLLGNVITGWQIGLPLMKKGGKATFLIPSDLAYGSRGQGSIPGNTPLIFDIDLIDFQ